MGVGRSGRRDGNFMEGKRGKKISGSFCLAFRHVVLRRLRRGEENELEVQREGPRLLGGFGCGPRGVAENRSKQKEGQQKRIWGG